MSATVLNMRNATSTSASDREITLQKLQVWIAQDNWEKVYNIFVSDSTTKTAVINPRGMTALHLAARCGNSDIVENMVDILTTEDLRIQDQQGRNALHIAAASSCLRAVKKLVHKNQDLVIQNDVYGYSPFFHAVRWGNPSKPDHKKVVEYLYHETPHRVYTDDHTRACNLIAAITASGCYGVACLVLDNYPELALARNENKWSLLRILASQPEKLLGEKKATWKDRISSIPSWLMNCTAPETHVHPRLKSDKTDSYEDLIEQVCEELIKRSFGEVMDYFLPAERPGILQTAVIHQVPTVIKVCLRYFPDLIWYSSPYDQKFLLHLAVEYRDKEIFDLVLKMSGENLGSFSGAIADENDNNIFHLAAKMAPTAQLNKLPGPAFQMQRELQWFRKVETIVFNDERIARNKANKTPVDLLFDSHSDLLTKATEWMKDAAESGMIIAALVATVAFASMITLPGGNNSETGMPLLYKKKQFVVFSIANAVSMISSAISLLLFLMIQISKYRVEDFIDVLPLKFVSALLALFVAVATMMLAFGLAIGMAFHTKVNWSYVPITLVACIPAIVFPCMQLPLLFQTVRLTVRSEWSWRY